MSNKRSSTAPKFCLGAQVYLIQNSQETELDAGTACKLVKSTKVYVCSFGKDRLCFAICKMGTACFLCSYACYTKQQRMLYCYQVLCEGKEHSVNIAFARKVFLAANLLSLKTPPSDQRENQNLPFLYFWSCFFIE